MHMTRVRMSVGKLAEQGLAILLLAAGGCASDEPAESNKPVTLVYYRHDDVAVAAADQVAFDAYTKAHPNVTFEVKVVNYNALLALLESDFATGVLKADLISVPPSYACGYAARLTAIPESTLSMAQARDAFLAAPLDGAICDGALMGFPREYNLEYGGILVNMKRYRDKLPGRSPRDWKTWEDVVSDAKQLTEYDADGKVTVAGLEFRHRDPIKHILLALILQQGGAFWNADHSAFAFNTPETRTALQWMADAALVHKYLNLDAPPPRWWALALVEEKAAMVYTGTWGNAVATQTAAMQGKPVELEYFMHPPFFGTEHKFVQNSGWALVVPRNSEHAAVALDVARFLTTDPGTVAAWSKTAGSISPLRAQTTPEALAPDPIKSSIQPLLDKGSWVGYMAPKTLTETRDSWLNNTLAAMRGLIKGADGTDQPFTAEQAALKIDQECNDSLMRSRGH
jgi:ABC-type glycerol-3-phosphate transport system substrate-binding protein